MWRRPPLLHRPLVAPPPRLFLPPRPYRALRMYAACPCPHAIQLLEVAANAPRRHQVLFPLHQRAVLRPRCHDKRSRDTVGSCVIALARKCYRNLTARTYAHPARDILHLMAHSRRANAKILLAYFLHLHVSLVLGHNYLVHAMVAQLPLHESEALFRSRSHSRNTSSGSASGSGASSRHNSHVSVSSTSAWTCPRA
jgi:hypothetical protein